MLANVIDPWLNFSDVLFSLPAHFVLPLELRWPESHEKYDLGNKRSSSNIAISGHFPKPRFGISYSRKSLFMTTWISGRFASQNVGL